MSLDDSENTTSDRHLQTKPVDLGNEEFLNIRLQAIREQYSYERLSDLSAMRLGATRPDAEGLSEEDMLRQEFRRLYRRFPNRNPRRDDESQDTWRRMIEGDDYRGLKPLTYDQKQQIEDCRRECTRDLDRARQDALEREESPGPMSRFGSWLVDFADAATPFFLRL